MASCSCSTRGSGRKSQSNSERSVSVTADASIQLSKRPAIFGWLAILVAGTPGRIGLALTLATLSVAVGGPILAPYGDTALVGTILQNPSRHHLLGTDQLGRDVFSRVLYGGRSVILLPSLAVTLAFGLGGGLGLVAGYRGGRLDDGITRAADILMSVPPLLLVMVLLVAL